MKTKHFLTVFCLLILGFFLTSCASMSTQGTDDVACTGQDLNPMVKKGTMGPNVDNFLVILDASSSMDDKTQKGWDVKERKFPLAKNLINCMNETIPDIQVNGGMRYFGPVHSESGLIYGITKYSKAGLGDAALSANKTGGITPIGNALLDGGIDLEEVSGKTAIILFSDGMNMHVVDPVSAAANVKNVFGNNLCIYTVHIGAEKNGKATMEAIAEAGQCGFATDAETLKTSGGMTDFVTKVFLAKSPMDPDSDGDGVPDSRDQCPNTPRGVQVDRVGCPLPMKEKVSITLRIEFDFDKDTIRPEYNEHIEKVADFMKAYLSTSAVLEGHTDSIGSEEYNMGLSKRRAASVKMYLVDKFGVSGSRITTKGYGESMPVATNKTDAGRQKNRRVVADIVTIQIK
jgi:OOP family OmpA-OmpF porin